MTAASIPVSRSAGYAAYLEGKTFAPERGDYYLGSDGLPAEAPGLWLVDPAGLARVGVEVDGDEVVAEDLRALMAGQRPGPGEPVWLRAAGPDGSRAGGIDVTFSAPKGVSVLWAIGSRRAEIEAAHRRAVAAAVGYLREQAELTVRYKPALGGTVPALAARLHAAEFLHTTARGVGRNVPDPQLHSHVVITSVERMDGSVAAVRSRPVLRSAREVGAFYRAQFATELRDLGYGVVPAGRDDRYFAIDGIPQHVERAFSARAREVEHAGREFRAQHGRDPERGELRALAVQTRAGKLPQTRADLDVAWIETARTQGITAARLADLEQPQPAVPDWHRWAKAVEQAATGKRATFTAAELRTVALEHAAGHGLDPRQAFEGIELLRERGDVLELADGRLTTAAIRRAEQAVEHTLTDMAGAPTRKIEHQAVSAGITRVEERLGIALSDEQRAAVERLTSPSRAAVLVGPAGTGKGVVIEAATLAEHEAGRQVFGLAVAGRTAQRLAETSPSLEGRVQTIDAFVNAVEHGQRRIGERTTVYLDEAGMGDTERLQRLLSVLAPAGASLVLIGDPRQLPSVGAGGMFSRVTQTLPVAELSEVHRARDEAQVAAWHELRVGDPAAALAHYRDRSQLHFADTRIEAVEHAAQRYLHLAAEYGHERVALMSDASNIEIDTLNSRIQTLRHHRGELSDEPLLRPGGQHFRVGDRVTWTEPMYLRDGPRVENGARGTVTSLDPRRDELTVQLDGSGREIGVTGQQHNGLRLAYASHVYRSKARPSTARSSSPVAGRHPAKAPTSTPPAHAKASTGTSPATSSTAPTTSPASGSSPSASATAAHRLHRSSTTSPSEHSSCRAYPSTSTIAAGPDDRRPHTTPRDHAQPRRARRPASVRARDCRARGPRCSPPAARRPCRLPRPPPRCPIPTPPRTTASIRERYCRLAAGNQAAVRDRSPPGALPARAAVPVGGSAGGAGDRGAAGRAQRLARAARQRGWRRPSGRVGLRRGTARRG